MYYWEVEEFLIIPLAYNIFYRETQRNIKHINVAQEYMLSGELFEELNQLLREENKKIAVDMTKVNYPGRMFEDLKDSNQVFFLYNIHTDILREKIKEDLEPLHWNEKEEICSMNSLTIIDIEQYENLFEKAYIKQYSTILWDIQKHYPEGRILDSSGLYSNRYIAVEKLFLKPEDYFFVLYGMVLEIEKEIDSSEFDGFISSSRNGAILAELLGSMMNKKVVHIVGVGPRYAMHFGNIQNEIKRGKAYVYVYDFICTGTELKILSALVNANDAYLKKSIGFARYENDEKEDKRIFRNVIHLITTKEAEMSYLISGSKESIKKLEKSIVYKGEAGYVN